jgi:hypothetical protein
MHEICIAELSFGFNCFMINVTLIIKQLKPNEYESTPVVDSTIFVDLHTRIIQRGVFLFVSKLNMCFNLQLSYILSLNLIN